MMYLGIGDDDASDLQWQADPQTGRQSIQRKGMSGGQLLLLAAAGYWMWREKDKSRIFPLALAWYVLTH